MVSLLHRDMGLKVSMDLRWSIVMKYNAYLGVVGTAFGLGIQADR
jgi:hypothetical protein